MDDSFAQTLQALKSNFDLETGRVSENQSIEEDEICRLVSHFDIRLSREKTNINEFA